MVVPIVAGAQIDASDFTGTRYRALIPLMHLPQNPARVTASINRMTTTTAGQNAFHAPIMLPDGATLTNIKHYFYREDASSSASWAIYKIAKDGSGSVPIELLTTTTISHTDGMRELDSGALSEVIDNSAFFYMIYTLITLNDSTNDAYISSSVITFTITNPKP